LLCKNSTTHDFAAQQRSPTGRRARVIVRVSARSAVRASAGFSVRTSAGFAARASVDSVVWLFAAARAEAGATAAGVWPSVGLAAGFFEQNGSIPREGAVADAAGAV
ncbi:unnamed protein product, partial [Pylaiella littoralis]